MRAVTFDKKPQFTADFPTPEPLPGWARIRVIMAGICGTDIEILKGYNNFKGIPGHEFVGIIDKSENDELINRRVAGNINVSCEKCSMCKSGLNRHCPHRNVLGILNLNGCMAEYLVLPVKNLIEIPDEIPDRHAVFIEPLSAAYRIKDQLKNVEGGRVIVLGDGPLGILCSWVLLDLFEDITLSGHHREKLEKARWRHLKTSFNDENLNDKADIVVEATGSTSGLNDAIEMVRPCGTIILKSTITGKSEIDFTKTVVNEQTIIGSRCGKMEDGLQMLKEYPLMPVDRLITAVFPIEDAVMAFREASRSSSLKILFKL